MGDHLRLLGYQVNRKRVRRLMKLMGLEAIYPKPRLSMRDKSHRIYPYLLRGLDITGPNHVWSTDITYIRMHRGFVYLTAVMDWWSRFVLSWEVSLTLETEFCLSALDRAFEYGRPEIFNSDQGAQFTSQEFTGKLLEEEVRISMDGRGRATDNVFVERLWRSVKYEEVYLHEYETPYVVEERLGNYFDFYNHERPHQSLKGRTPGEIYRQRG